MTTAVKDHAALAEEFNANEPRVNWHDETLWWVRQKRDKMAWSIPEWEQLRETASRIKHNVLGNLHAYLEEFERNAQQNGAIVH
ncbi:MAG TPA: 4Fe-4S ferredoxin, partial [Chitinophaga sp.]|nr:4Fe-4S ferredoxin [Chitinophaga sp.]